MISQNGLNLLRTLHSEKNCKLYVCRNMLTIDSKECKQITQNTIDYLVRKGMLQRTATEYILTKKAQDLIGGCS